MAVFEPDAEAFLKKVNMINMTFSDLGFGYETPPKSPHLGHRRYIWHRAIYMAEESIYGKWGTYGIGGFIYGTGVIYGRGPGG